MLLTIVAIFFLCWGPKLILDVLKGLHLESLRTPTAFKVMVRAEITIYPHVFQASCTVVKVVMFKLFQLALNLLPYLQSAANPVIYGFMSRNFRHSMDDLFKKLCPCCGRRNSAKRNTACNGIPLQSATTRLTHNDRSSSFCL